MFYDLSFCPEELLQSQAPKCFIQMDVNIFHYIIYIVILLQSIQNDTISDLVAVMLW